MTTDALFRRIWNLHAHAPEMARYDPSGLTRIHQEVAQIIDEVSRVLAQHSAHAQLAPIMRDHYADALLGMLPLLRDLECLMEDVSVPTDSMEWHVTTVIAVVTSMVVDLLFRVLEVYAELAANLDGSHPGFEQASRLLQDCRRLVQPEPETDQRLQQLAYSLTSITTTDLDA